MRFCKLPTLFETSVSRDFSMVDKNFRTIWKVYSCCWLSQGVHDLNWDFTGEYTRLLLSCGPFQGIKTPTESDIYMSQWGESSINEMHAAYICVLGVHLNKNLPFLLQLLQLGDCSRLDIHLETAKSLLSNTIPPNVYTQHNCLGHCLVFVKHPDVVVPYIEHINKYHIHSLSSFCS